MKTTKILKTISSFLLVIILLESCLPLVKIAYARVDEGDGGENAPAPEVQQAPEPSPAPSPTPESSAPPHDEMRTEIREAVKESRVEPPPPPQSGSDFPSGYHSPVEPAPIIPQTTPIQENKIESRLLKIEKDIAVTEANHQTGHLPEVVPSKQDEKKEQQEEQKQIREEAKQNKPPEGPPTSTAPTPPPVVTAPAASTQPPAVSDGITCLGNCDKVCKDNPTAQVCVNWALKSTAKIDSAGNCSGGDCDAAKILQTLQALQRQKEDASSKVAASSVASGGVLSPIVLPKPNNNVDLLGQKALNSLTPEEMNNLLDPNSPSVTIHKTIAGRKGEEVEVEIKKIGNQVSTIVNSLDNRDSGETQNVNVAAAIETIKNRIVLKEAVGKEKAAEPAVYVPSSISVIPSVIREVPHNQEAINSLTIAERNTLTAVVADPAKLNLKLTTEEKAAYWTNGIVKEIEGQKITVSSDSNNPLMAVIAINGRPAAEISRDSLGVDRRNPAEDAKLDQAIDWQARDNVEKTAYLSNTIKQLGGNAVDFSKLETIAPYINLAKDGRGIILKDTAGDGIPDAVKALLNSQSGTTLSMTKNNDTGGNDLGAHLLRASYGEGKLIDFEAEKRQALEQKDIAKIVSSNVSDFLVNGPLQGIFGGAVKLGRGVGQSGTVFDAQAYHDYSDYLAAKQAIKTSGLSEIIKSGTISFSDPKGLQALQLLIGPELVVETKNQLGVAGGANILGSLALGSVEPINKTRLANEELEKRAGLPAGTGGFATKDSPFSLTEAVFFNPNAAFHKQINQQDYSTLLDHANKSSPLDNPAGFNDLQVIITTTSDLYTMGTNVKGAQEEEPSTIRENFNYLVGLSYDDLVKVRPELKDKLSRDQFGKVQLTLKSINAYGEVVKNSVAGEFASESQRGAQTAIAFDLLGFTVLGSVAEHGIGAVKGVVDKKLLERSLGTLLREDADQLAARLVDKNLQRGFAQATISEREAVLKKLATEADYLGLKPGTKIGAATVLDDTGKVVAKEGGEVIGAGTKLVYSNREITLDAFEAAKGRISLQDLDHLVLPSGKTVTADQILQELAIGGDAVAKSIAVKLPGGEANQVVKDLVNQTQKRIDTALSLAEEMVVVPPSKLITAGEAIPVKIPGLSLPEEVSVPCVLGAKTVATAKVLGCKTGIKRQVDTLLTNANEGTETLKSSQKVFVLGREGDILVSGTGKSASTVSRKHVEIIVDGDRVTLKDLADKGSTFSVKADANIPVTSLNLKNGDIVGLGEVDLQFLGLKNGVPEFKPLNKSVSVSAPQTVKPSQAEVRKVFSLGRGDDVDIVISNDSTVSRDHASITVSGNKATIQDLGSRNGTFVNDQGVTGSVELKPNDVVSVGKKTDLRFLGVDKGVPKFEINPSVKTVPEPVQKGARQEMYVYRASNGQELVIDLANDSNLKQVLNRAVAEIDDVRAKSNNKISRLDAAAKWITDAISYDEELQQSIYAAGGGRAGLGQIICNSSVCREKAFFGHLVLDELDIKSEVWVGRVKEDRHAWLYIPDRDIIVDPTSFHDFPPMPRSNYVNKRGIDESQVEKYSVFDTKEKPKIDYPLKTQVRNPSVLLGSGPAQFFEDLSNKLIYDRWPRARTDGLLPVIRDGLDEMIREENQRRSVLFKAREQINQLVEKVKTIFGSTGVKSFLPVVSPAYAAETSQAISLIVPQSIYKSLLTKAAVIEEINGRDPDKISDSEIGQIFDRASRATSNLPASGYQAGNDYVLVTGSDGIVFADLPKGNYSVKISPIDGVDIASPTTVEIPFGPVPIINIGVSKGSGQIKAVTNKTTVTADKAIFRVYHDGNNNGVKDVKEQFLPWSGVKINLTKMSVERKIHLVEGWTSVAFPVVPGNIKTASDLILEIIRQGGYATTVARFENGAWEEFVMRGSARFGTDFSIEPGRGYMIRNHLETDVAAYGPELTSKPALKLKAGYNFVGVVSQKKYTASLVTNQAEVVKTVTEYESGLLRPFVKDDGKSYGKDFTINEVKGYFFRAKKDEILQL